MGKTNDAEMMRLFSEAEQRKTCLVPPSPRVRETLRRHVKQGKAVHPARGMYARASYWRSLSKPQQALWILRAMQTLHPTWTFCHESAALAFGLSVSHEKLNEVHVVTSPSSRNASSESVHWHIVQNDEPVIVQGLRVTSLARTAFDCMRTADFKRALAIADSTLRLSGRSGSSFPSSFKRMRGSCAGTVHAARTMYYADALSESGGESMARAAMIELGFALPQLQVSFPRPLDRNRSFRVDFLWTRLDGSKVIGEFDGKQKYEDEAMRNGRTPLRVLADEQHRESQLTLLGMPIVRFSYGDILNANRFASLLKLYDIPHSDEIARTERRLARSKLLTAQIFTVESLET